jgi:hypothetical protein
MQDGFETADKTLLVEHPAYACPGPVCVQVKLPREVRQRLHGYRCQESLELLESSFLFLSPPPSDIIVRQLVELPGHSAEVRNTLPIE